MILKKIVLFPCLTHNSKVVFVSHNDLDGVGPIIIGKNYFNDCKYFTVSNSAVDKTVKYVLFGKEYQDREFIFITDCSVVDEELIHHINMENKKGYRKIFLFDHHATALSLNKYDWAHVTQESGVSGTKLFWRYLEERVCEQIGTQRFLKLDNLVNKISDYDTWQWFKKNDRECYELSNLFTETGVDYFLQKYVGSALDRYKEFNIFNEADEALMSDFKRKFEYVIWPAIQKSAITMNFTFEVPVNGVIKHILKKVKCVTITTAVGDLSEKLYEDGIDYVVFFYHDSVSVRSRVDDIDLGAWARYMGNGHGGGGHNRAAGFPLLADNFYLYRNYLFTKFNYEEE